MSDETRRLPALIKVGDVMDWIRGLAPDPRLAVEAEVSSEAEHPVPQEGTWGRFRLTALDVEGMEMEEVAVSLSSTRGLYIPSLPNVRRCDLSELLLAPGEPVERDVPTRFSAVDELVVPLECLLEELHFPSLAPPPLQVALALDLERTAAIEEVLLEDSPPPVLAMLPWEPRLKFDMDWMG